MSLDNTCFLVQLRLAVAAIRPSGYRIFRCEAFDKDAVNGAGSWAERAWRQGRCWRHLRNVIQTGTHPRFARSTFLKMSDVAKRPAAVGRAFHDNDCNYERHQLDQMDGSNCGGDHGEWGGGGQLFGVDDWSSSCLAASGARADHLSPLDGGAAVLLMASFPPSVRNRSRRIDRWRALVRFRASPADICSRKLGLFVLRSAKALIGSA